MKHLKKIHCKTVASASVALVILFMTCKLMLKGVGINSSVNNVLLLLSLIIILNSSRKSFWYLVLPMCFFYAIYSPIGIIFGRPTYQYIASIFATNVLESKEFFTQIPLLSYIAPFSIILGILTFRYISVKFNVNFYRNRTLLCFIIIFAMINQTPSEFFKDVITSSKKVKDELVALNTLNIASEWGESSLYKSKYNNYILIIGESARSDYHHAYGYPINNTPFMSTSNGVLVDGLKSGGTNTVASLRLMLTKSDTINQEPNYSLNFIDLAKSAGIETHWISNQGYIGEFDTPISAIAKRSDFKSFLKYGDYKSKNTSDFLLLDRIKTIVKENPKQKKLIVVHLYGSHPDACDRIVDYKKIVSVTDEKHSYINCYVSSINKTDDFIKYLHSFMSNEKLKNDEPFSILYFSDHGLVHREMNGVVYLDNSRVSKSHYNIPLFEVSSDSNERKKCKSFKSGLNFINGIANWIGITNRQLSPDYNLFDCNDDQNDYGLHDIIDNLDGEADPAIDISKK